MDFLSELLSSRVRAAVLTHLFGVAETELHGRELARRSGHSEASLRQELAKLVRLDVLVARRDGNRVYYSANRHHPLWNDLHGLVLKTRGLADVIRAALDQTACEIAFVFGSVADGSATAKSDVDLLVVGDISLRDLAGVLAAAAAGLGREINPHILSRNEYRKRLEKGDHFVNHVLSGPKIFIIGSENELAAMGSERLAET